MDCGAGGGAGLDRAREVRLPRLTSRASTIALGRSGTRSLEKTMDTLFRTVMSLSPSLAATAALLEPPRTRPVTRVVEGVERGPRGPQEWEGAAPPLPADRC